MSLAMQRKAISALIALALTVSLLLSGAPTVSAQNNNAACFDPSVPLTQEERQLQTTTGTGTVPVAQQLLESSGFDAYVAAFEKALCSAPNLKNAENIVRQHGQRLWDNALARAQGRGSYGELNRYDDRPLFWARVSMTKMIRQWTPSFAVSEEDRAHLLHVLEYNSRGITSVNFPSGKGVKRILVSGFDPYGLVSSIRNGNPSGASILQMDGMVVDTDSGPVFVQAVMLPVRWQDFTDGIVEDAFGPYLAEGKQQVDLIMTISQGSRGRMQIEGWAGAWRGGSADNNGFGRAEPIPTVDRWPMPDPLPQFIRTTLPWQAMIDAGTGPWPTVLNERICEIPPGSSTQTCHTNGPTPGSQARSGGGGNYLSNESQYRTNRLRLGFGLTDLPGGHLHISSLQYPSDRNLVTDPAFEADRDAIIDQTVALVKAAARALD